MSNTSKHVACVWDHPHNTLTVYRVITRDPNLVTYSRTTYLNGIIDDQDYSLVTPAEWDTLTQPRLPRG